MADTPEGRVKKNVKALLTTSGAYFFMPVQTGLGGDTLDFIGFRKPDGRGFVIETKAPLEKPTARQRKRLREVYATGAAVFVIDGLLRDLKLLEEWLRDEELRRGSLPERMIERWFIWQKEDEIA